MSVRYYLYISDSKIEMLLPQIDAGWTRKRVTELSLDLKAAGAKRTVETPEPDRVARLERVIRHLESHGGVGSIDEPGGYVYGVLPMQWTVIGDGTAVYFGGRSERTIVGLGGSAEHVLGGVAAVREGVSPSLLPALANQLGALTGEEPIADAGTLTTVVQANASLRGPSQAVEFLAKRLLHGPCPYPELFGGRDDMSVLLASPLYVASAE